MSTYRNEGLRALLREIRRKAWTHQKAVWLARDLSVPLNSAPITANTTQLFLEIDFSHPEETIGWLSAQNILGTADPRELKVAREYGHLLPSVKSGGEIVAYLKIGFDRVYVLDFRREFDFPAGTAFIYDTYVAPGLRGRNIAPFLIDRTSEFMREKGYSQIYCHIRVKNAASIKAYQKCGFEQLRVISFFHRLFPVTEKFSGLDMYA